MRVWLVRHGIAVDRADPACPPDFDRPLTDRGRRLTRRAARGLDALGVSPERILSSPLLRARETAEIIADTLSVAPAPIETLEALEPDRAPEELWEALQELSVEAILCAGHAPQVDLFLGFALGAHGEVAALKKSGAACIQWQGELPGTASLDWLLRPRMLRILGKKRS